MDMLLFILPWVCGSAAAGFLLGTYTVSKGERRAAARQRETTLKVLAAALQSTDQLNVNVNHYNSEIREVEQNLADMHTEGDAQHAQQALLSQVALVLDSNQRLQDDLTVTRLQMEEQAQEIDRARKEARTDPLSGIGNRKAFDERLEMFLTFWRREKRPFVLVMADIDHFKWINDCHGHRAGDQVIENVGKLLRGCVRDQDFVARYGGDEFAILIGDTDLDMASLITERVRDRISTHNYELNTDTEKGAITFSIGMANVWEGATADELMARADAALYRSKHAGRNAVFRYQDAESIVPVTHPA